MTAVPSNLGTPNASAHAPGQSGRPEAARKAAEPFALPPEERPRPKAISGREPARRPERADEVAADQRDGNAAAGARDMGGRGPAAPASKRDDARQDTSPETAKRDTSDAEDAAENDTAWGEQAIMATDATLIAVQQASAEVPGDMVSEQTAPDEAALEAAVAVMVQPNGATTDQALVTAGAGGQDGGVSASSAAGSGLPVAGDAASLLPQPAMGDATEPAGIMAATTGTPQASLEAGALPVTGEPRSADAKSVAGGTSALPSSEPKPVEGQVADGTSAEARMTADKQADQAGAASGAARNELASRLEQGFAQPPARPAEHAPGLLPASSPPPELPRAIPPSAVPMEIGLRSLQGLKEFQIRLDPAELGRIDVKLEIGDDRSVTARVVVDRVETLHLLQREAKTLERAFEQAGLKSSDASVDITLRDPGQQSGQGRREGWPDETETGFGRSGRNARPAAVETPVVPIRRMLHVGALDLSI